MKILAFDTTNNTMSVAIIDENKLAANKSLLEKGIQAEKLIPVIEECLNEAGIWYQDLDLLAITNGPGSFTGVRVGFSAAKAIELGTNNLPLVAVSSLEAVAYDYKSGIYENQKYHKIFIVADAKLDELFIQEFTVSNTIPKPIYQPKIIAHNKIINFIPKGKFLLAGSAKSLIAQELKDQKFGFILSTQNDYIKAANVGLLAKNIYQRDGKKAAAVNISYIRKPRINKK